MATYLMMNGDTVINLIVADDKDATEKALRCVLIEQDPQNPVGIGWRLVNGEWIQPQEEPNDFDSHPNPQHTTISSGPNLGEPQTPDA